MERDSGRRTRIPMHLVHRRFIFLTAAHVLPCKRRSRCGARTTPDEPNGTWPLLLVLLHSRFYLTWFSDLLPTAPSTLPLTHTYPSSNWITSFYRCFLLSLPDLVCFSGASVFAPPWHMFDKTTYKIVDLKPSR